MFISLQIGAMSWLLFSLIVTSAFKSSLIAHLTIQGRSHPPDTLDDLVTSDGWRWATEPWLLKGVPYEYFSKHPDPVVKEIHNKMQVSYSRFQGWMLIHQLITGAYARVQAKPFPAVTPCSLPSHIM